MSKICNESIVGQLFKPIITPMTDDELKQFEKQSIGINNAIIFSIPQTSSGEDDKGKGSIWLTDSNGYVYQLTKPISQENGNT